MNTDKIFAQSIANEYAPKSESRVVALKKLDRRAKRASNVFAYIFGTVSSLILGTGMCLAMKVIGPKTLPFFIAGIVIGVIGIIGMSINYPIYKRLRERGKKKYAFEIMELAREICEREK